MRWFLLAVTTLGIVVAGLPAVSASAAATGVITGTVNFHETSPDRTLHVYVAGTNGAFVEDRSLRTVIAGNGAYSVQVPGGKEIKLRVSFGAPEYGYWYGDTFDESVATAIPVAAGETVPDVVLDVPVPVSYSGRLLDRSGNPVSGTVVPTTNTHGASAPITAAVPVDASGEYHVILPARFGEGVYENGVIAYDASNEYWAWLDRDAESPGGNGYEPNYYLNPLPGETHDGEDITLPVGSSSSVVAPSAGQPATATKFRSTRSPVVRGAIRKGALLHATAGRFSARPTTLRYQWLRNGKAIRGAHTSAYRLKKADVRKRISVRVTATRSGARVLATSARTHAVRAR